MNYRQSESPDERRAQARREARTAIDSYVHLRSRAPLLLAALVAPGSYAIVRRVHALQNYQNVATFVAALLIGLALSELIRFAYLRYIVHR